MQISERTVGDVIIVDVAGKITLGDGGDVALRDKMRSLIQQDLALALLNEAPHLVPQCHVSAVAQRNLARDVDDDDVTYRPFRDVHQCLPRLRP